MADILNPRQLIQLAQSLTRFQMAITDFEIRQYAALNDAQKMELEETLTVLATAAGRLYAYSVQLAFEEAEEQLLQIRAAAEGLNKFLKTARKIQEVLDIVESVASLADAIISHDLEGITMGIDQVIQMVGNN